MTCAGLRYPLLFLVCAAGCASSRPPPPRAEPAIVEPALPDGWCSGIERYVGDWGPEQRATLDKAFRSSIEGEVVSVADQMERSIVASAAKVAEYIGYQVATWAVEYERMCARGARVLAHRCYLRRRDGLRAFLAESRSEDDAFADVMRAAYLGWGLECDYRSIDRGRPLLDRAVRAWSSGDGATAIEQARRAVSRTGVGIDASFLLIGMVETLAEQYATLFPATNAAVELGDASREAEAWILWIELEAPSPDASPEELAREALARAERPPLLTARLERAVGARAVAAGDLVGARRALTAALQLYRDSPAERMEAADAWVELVTVAFRAMSDDRAVLLEAALAALDHAYGQGHPTGAAQRVVLGDVVLGSGDSLGATALYAHADSALSDISLAYPERAPALHGLAMAREKVGDLAGAIAVYAQAADELEAVGGHATWLSLTMHHRLAELYLQAGDYEAAAAVATEARQASADATDDCTLCAELARDLGAAQRAQGDVAAAATAYAEALSFAANQDVDPLWRAALLRDTAYTEIQLHGRRADAIAKAREALGLFIANDAATDAAAVEAWLAKHAPLSSR